MKTKLPQKEAPNWKVTDPHDWAVHIDRKLYERIFAYTKHCPDEIAGFGDVDIDVSNKVYRITKLRMYKQEVTGSSVDQDEKALGDAIVEAMSSGDDLSKVKFEWHSHVDMGVFWSSTDESCCKMLLNCSKDFYIFFVVNKKGELLSRIDYLFNMKDHPIQLTHHCIPVVVTDEVDTTIEEEAKQDIEKFIVKKASSIITNSASNTGHSYLASKMCEVCKSSIEKTRYDFSKKIFVCKDCDTEESKEVVTASPANCPKCNRYTTPIWNGNTQEFTWFCATCNEYFVPPSRKQLEELKENGKALYDVWCKCEQCNDEALCSYYPEHKKWLCICCVHVLDQTPQSFQDDRGRYWYYGHCEQCQEKTGLVTEDYVTFASDVNKELCSGCWDEHLKTMGRSNE